ncbi:MAG TPA: hypothetical protein PLN53_02000 [Terricaulis sp.]|nr:hypothetical protein [Terricaulis sp.]
MRIAILAAGLALAACASPAAHVSTSTLAAADAATSLLVGEQLTQEIVSRAPEQEGMDPLETLTLRHADGRTLVFQHANHTPHDLMAQAAGGPLAQIMGLFGEEAPTLYHRVEGGQGSPFICAPDGPQSLGAYTGADGAIQIVGLKQAIEFETRPDGQTEAVPYSPDQVCARLRFTAQ